MQTKFGNATSVWLSIEDRKISQLYIYVYGSK